MREILFRGKIDKKSPFYYGNLHIVTCKKPQFEIWQLDGNIHHCITVMKETVGQYTGLLDRNGNKIFEGDILKADVLCNTCGASPKPIYIHFADGAFCWAENKNDEKDTLALCDSEHFRDLKLYEVIGNIYDNIELMEQK